MQPFTAAQGMLLKRSAALNVTPGVRIAVPGSGGGFTAGKDLTAWYVPGASVTSDISAGTSRSVSISLDSSAPFNYVRDWVQPYVTFTDADSGVAYTFNLGVYALTSPTLDHSATPTVVTYTGYDLTSLLNVPVGDSIQVSDGTDPVEAAARLIPQALSLIGRIRWVPSGAAATQPLVYPLDEQDNWTWLDVINDLLASVGYLPLWADWNGDFRLTPAAGLLSAASEWTFDVQGPYNVVAQDRSSDQDIFDVPNYWRFIMANLTDPPVEGQTQYTYADTATALLPDGHTAPNISGTAKNPACVEARGRLVKSIDYITTPTSDAASYAALVSAATTQIATDLQPAETFAVTTAPFPLMWHWDRITYIDDNLPGANGRNCLVTSWTFSLDGNDTTWVWKTIPAGQGA